MAARKVPNLRPVLPRLWALIEGPLTRAAFDAHCARFRWARLDPGSLLPEEFEVRIGPGLILRGSFEPEETAWHGEIIVLWDRRWDTSKGDGKRLFCHYDMPHPEFDAAFNRTLAAGVAALGEPTGRGQRRPRYNYSWPTRRHAFWAAGDRVLLLAQSEDPGAGGRSVVVWVGPRSLLRRNPYLPHRLKATPP